MFNFFFEKFLLMFLKSLSLSPSPFPSQASSLKLQSMRAVHGRRQARGKVLSERSKGTHVVPEETKACGVTQDVDHDSLWLAMLNEGLLSAVFTNWQHTARLRRAHIH